MTTSYLEGLEEQISFDISDRGLDPVEVWKDVAVMGIDNLISLRPVTTVVIEDLAGLQRAVLMGVLERGEEEEHETMKES